MRCVKKKETSWSKSSLLVEATRNLITKKHASSRKAASNNTDENRRAYNKIRNKVSHVMKKLKKNFEKILPKKLKRILRTSLDM